MNRATWITSTQDGSVRTVHEHVRQRASRDGHTRPAQPEHDSLTISTLAIDTRSIDIRYPERHRMINDVGFASHRSERNIRSTTICPRPMCVSNLPDTYQSGGHALCSTSQKYVGSTVRPVRRPLIVQLPPPNSFLKKEGRFFRSSSPSPLWGFCLLAQPLARCSDAWRPAHASGCSV